MQLRPDDAFLDIACGTGAAVRQAAGVVDRAAGFDLSPAMVARARALAQGLPNVEFHEGDASGRLPFADREFTAILCTTAFHHFPDPQSAVDELARVLAPEGRVVIGDANADHLVVRALDAFLRWFQRSHVRFHRPREVIGLLERAGLTGPRVRTLWRGGYALVSAAKR